MDFVPPTVHLAAAEVEHFALPTEQDAPRPPVTAAEAAARGEPAPVVAELEPPRQQGQPLERDRLELALSGLVVTFSGLHFDAGPGTPAANVMAARWTWLGPHVLLENIDPYTIGNLPIMMRHAVQNRLLARFNEWKTRTLNGSVT